MLWLSSYAQFKILRHLYLTVVAVLAVTTVFEKYQGTDFVHYHVYSSWWFIMLWVVFAILAVFFFLRRKIHHILLVLHFSFILILIGALLTHLFGWRGIVHLRMNETTETYFVKNSKGEVSEKRLPFKITLLNFSKKYYINSNAVKDYKTNFMINYNINASVSMNKIYTYHNIRFYQSDYDEDGRGSILALNYDPWGISVTYLGYILLIVSFLYFLFRQSGKALKFNMAFAVFTILLCLFFNETHLLQKDSRTGYIVPILNSPWFCIHVGTIMVAYLLFLLTFINSIVALLTPLFNKSVRNDINNYYSLQKSKMEDPWSANSFNFLCLSRAMALLALGICVGAIWANHSWGTYWNWDPKEVWALITFMVYAIPLHNSFIPSLRKPHNYHLFMIIAFFTLLITFGGCNYFLSGMHSYV